MKKLFTCLALFSQLSLFSQTWLQEASLPITDGIQGCFSFSINGKLYVGGGYDAIIGNVVDGFYQYDPSTNTWTTEAPVPIAVGTNDGFVLNGMGYIACGTVSGNTLSNFVYQYNPNTNTWTQMNNFPGTARQNHICFSLNGYGYMFGGFTGGSNVVGEMWQYNDSTDSWTQMATCPGPGRNGPGAMVINNNAYVGFGSSSSGSPTYSDFYLFNPISNSYTLKDSIPVSRGAGAHFAVGNYGYTGLGYSGTGYGLYQS